MAAKKKATRKKAATGRRGPTKRAKQKSQPTKKPRKAQRAQPARPAPPSPFHKPGRVEPAYKPEEQPGRRVPPVKGQVANLPRGYKVPEHLNSMDEIDVAEGLTPRQAKFVEARLQGMGSRQAAKYAGFSASSDHALDVAAHRMMTNVEVASRVRAGMLATKVNREEVLGMFRAGAMDGLPQFLAAVESPDGTIEYVPDVNQGIQAGAGHKLKKLKYDLGPDRIVKVEIECFDTLEYKRVLAEHVGLVRGKATPGAHDDVIAAVAMSHEEMIAFLAERGERIGDALVPQEKKPGTDPPPALPGAEAIDVGRDP